MRSARVPDDQPLSPVELRRVVRYLLANEQATYLKLWSVMGTPGRRSAGARFAVEQAAREGTLTRTTAADGVVYYALSIDARHRFAQGVPAEPADAIDAPGSLFAAPVPAPGSKPAAEAPTNPPRESLIDQARRDPAGGDIDKQGGPAHNGTPTSQAGARHIAGKASNLRSFVVAALWMAGERGLTLQELTPIISRKRGTPTKETSLTGRLDELSGYVEGKLDRLRQWAVKTTLRRDGGAGVPCAVWVHIKKWKPAMGDQKAIDFAKRAGGKTHAQ